MMVTTLLDGELAKIEARCTIHNKNLTLDDTDIGGSHLHAMAGGAFVLDLTFFSCEGWGDTDQCQEFWTAGVVVWEGRDE